MKQVGFAALSALLVAACTTAPPPSPAPIVAAERAFAADGYARGVRDSFLAWSAPGAIMLSPGPTRVTDVFAGPAPVRDPDAPVRHLIWWPLWAGISASGDLGFTTGPYAIEADRQGYYFTVWALQPDGSWKWVIDAGTGADASGAAGPETAPGYLQVSPSVSGTPDAALADVAVLEAAIALAAPSSLLEAYAGHLAPDARIHTAGVPPATDPAHFDDAIIARPDAMTLQPLGGGASKAGDMVWTYGRTDWAEGDQSRSGHYVRVWQKRMDGWRIVFDELVPSADG